MKGLLNFLTVLAPLLNLAAGCGLQQGAVIGPGLLNVGAALVRQRLAAGSADATLATMGAGTGVGSRGSLLGRISRISGTGLGGGLTGGGSGLGTSEAVAGLGALRTQLGGATGTSLLSDLGALAVDRLRARGASGVITSGPTIPVPGLTRGQGASHAFAGAVILAGGVPGNSGTPMGPQPAGSTTLNFQSSSASQSTSALIGSNGVVSSPTGPVAHPGALGGVPGTGTGGVLRAGIGTLATGVNQVQQYAQSVQHVNQAVGGAVGTTDGAPGNSATPMGPQPGGSTTLHFQSSSASQSTSALIGSNGVAPSPTGPVGHPGALSRLPGTGTGGVLQAGFGTLATGARQMHTLGQSVQQTSQALAATVIGATDGATRNTVAGIGAHPAGSPAGTLPGAIANQGRGALPGSSSLFPFRSGPGSTLGPRHRETLQQIDQVTTGTSVVSLGASRPSGANLEAGPGGSSAGPMLTGRGSFGGGGPASSIGSVPNGAGSPIPLGTNQAPGLGQGPGQIEQALGAANIAGGSATLQSAANMGLQVVGTATQTVLGATSRVSGAFSGAPTPSGGIIQDPNGAVSGPAGLPNNNPVLGLGQGPNQMSQALGGAISRGGAGAVQSTLGMGLQMTGRSTQSLQGVTSSVSGGTTGAGTSLEGMGPGPSEANSGWSPGRAPGQQPQPNSQTPGGRSFLSLTSSSHSSSSYHAAHVSRTTSMSGLPTSPAGGSSGTGVSNEGGNLLGAIIAASTGGAPQAGPGTVGGGGLNAHGSSSTSESVSSSVVSATGIGQHQQLPPRKRMSPAAVAGLTLGSVAGAVALSAIGATLASAAHSGRLGGGRRLGGCSGGGCSGGCGRKRRSLSQSRVPAEVLNNIHMNFDRLY